MTDVTEHGLRNADVLALQMDALYKGAPAAVLSIFGAAFGSIAYWSPENRTMLIVWLACISTVALFHLATALLRHWGLPKSWSPVAWSHLVKGIYIAAGLSWGIGGAILLQHGDEHQALVICCLAMGAVSVTFPVIVYTPAYCLFQTPIFLSFTYGLAISNLEYGMLLSVAAALLSMVLLIIAYSMGGQMVLALRLSQENRLLVEQLAERGMALEAVNRDLTVQTLTDPLTGLANRRQLMGFMRRATGRCALLIVDVDHFKSYNDTFGHGDGDICLVLVAEALQRSVQEANDLVARQGGEEFAIVLTDLGEDRAFDVAELIRSNVQALYPTNPRKVHRQITVSIGFAYRDAELHKTTADLMAEADAALYEAKNSGRNRVSMLTDRRNLATG
ncbi:diguanylate cyclase [Rhizobium sp. XQZ8]|uniref:sensor domain-containing diguanylate cyclase n=1 Tax=Rhizobium populisoli TaxID=2859785 RepID=UPI001CA55DEB|nr:diguanylate cyclase [Rhizobium populisoli]MBW6423121.1 diguanylate cyclase [Rhizobium populisoli]